MASRLAAVDGTVAQTTECTAASADGGAAASAPAPSPLAYSPPFSAFLERCLELTDTHKELGPAPAVLLLQIVSRLSYAADPALREAFRRRFYLPLRVALEAAVDLHEKAITPQVRRPGGSVVKQLCCYLRWPRCACMPPRPAAGDNAPPSHAPHTRAPTALPCPPSRPAGVGGSV